jgi:PAS domain-containing protein
VEYPVYRFCYSVYRREVFIMKSKPFTETVIKLALPFILLVVLLLLAIFFVFIPMAKKHALKNQKETLEDLTLVTWSTLSYYQNLEKSGTLSKKQAQSSAIAQLRNIRYGENKKHYFWIINLRGITLMHPYNPANEGLNLADMTDIDGKYFIKDFIKTANKQKEGFVTYKWQIDDNSKKIGTKISHIRVFTPWGWIIGTGSYIDDIDIDLISLIWPVILIVLLIMGLVAIIYFYILKNFISSEQKKQTSFEKILMQDSKMKALLEAIPDMIVRIDRDGVVLDVKDPIGFKPFINPSEILDNKIIDAWPKSVAEKLIASIERVFVTNEHQVLIFDASGEATESMHIEAHFVLSGGDEILATFRDITKRKI